MSDQILPAGRSAVAVITLSDTCCYHTDPLLTELLCRRATSGAHIKHRFPKLLLITHAPYCCDTHVTASSMPLRKSRTLYKLSTTTLQLHSEILPTPELNLVGEINSFFY